jgi:predicted RNA-binding Zn-ribbon protein involved in translation (DUF1610 family)
MIIKYIKNLLFRDKTEKVRREKEEYKKRKAEIEKFLDADFERRKKEWDEAFDKKWNIYHKINSTCPNCGGKNIIDILPRTESGKIILKCNDCGHERYKLEVSEHIKPGFNGDIKRAKELLECIRSYLRLSYDPNNTKEIFDSLEEKQKNFIETHKMKEYKGAPRYIIEYSLSLVLKPGELGMKRKDDHYSYTLPSNIWPIVEKLCS